MKTRTLLLSCVLITLLTVAAILTFGRSYTTYLATPYSSSSIETELSQEGIVEIKSAETKNGVTKIVFRAKKPGFTSVSTTVRSDENPLNYTGVMYDFTVLPTGVLYLSGYDFGGYQFVVFGMMMLTFVLFLYFFSQFKKKKKSLFFSYKTVLDLGLSLFFGLESAMYLALCLICVVFPERADGWQIYNLAGFITSAVFIISIPLLVLFAGFLSFSNLSLIRHEGFRPSNLFGIFISVALLFGSCACIYTILVNPDSIGVSFDEIKDAVIRSIVSSAFIYFESILFATQICTQYAAKHEPKYNQDFIVILGCKVRDDGTPTPLLKGRIDRAIKFYRNQLESTGKQASFIPSGGQGSDEVISEAECMKNYLIEQGIDESIIFPETKSTTTLENMRFSKAIADEHKKKANILFSTTNYHIFRSGIYSAKAGMRADGIGAKTKWYFWPNAQMREFIGLVVNEWRTNLIFLFLFVFLATLLANTTTLINLIAK